MSWSGGAAATSSATKTDDEPCACLYGLGFRESVLKPLRRCQMPLGYRNQLGGQALHLRVVDPRQGMGGAVEHHLVILDHRLEEFTGQGRPGEGAKLVERGVETRH